MQAMNQFPQEGGEGSDSSAMAPPEMLEGSEGMTMPSMDPSQRPQAHGGFRPGQNSGSSQDSGEMMPSQSFDPMMMPPGMTGENGGQTMPAPDESGQMPAEGFMPSESFDPSAMTPPAIPEGSDGQMAAPSGDPAQGTGGRKENAESQAEISQDAEVSSTEEELTAETLILDAGAAVLLAAALVFVKLYQKPLH